MIPTATATASTLPLLLLLLSAAAQSPAPAPSELVGGSGVPVASAPGPSAVDCTTLLLNLADCLSYVQRGSNLTVPEKPCCGELSELIKTQPICLCEFLNNSTKAVGVEIDVPRALKLQTICKVGAGVSVSLCSVVGYPVAGVPTNSPLAPGMSPGGVAPSSETEKGKGVNGASGIQFSHPISSLVCLAIALFLPTLFSS